MCSSFGQKFAKFQRMFRRILGARKCKSLFLNRAERNRTWRVVRRLLDRYWLIQRRLREFRGKGITRVAWRERNTSTLILCVFGFKLIYYQKKKIQSIRQCGMHIWKIDIWEEESTPWLGLLSKQRDNRTWIVRRFVWASTFPEERKRGTEYAPVQKDFGQKSIPKKMPKVSRILGGMRSWSSHLNEQKITQHRILPLFNVEQIFPEQKEREGKRDRPWAPYIHILKDSRFREHDQSV